MRPIFIFLLLLVACGSSPPDEEISSISQSYIGPPPPTINCDSPRVLCGISCVDISRDMKNCGGCGEECNVTIGEFCLAYYCRNVRDFGFTFEPNGPRDYDVRRDLPRPSPIGREEK